MSVVKVTVNDKILKFKVDIFDKDEEIDVDSILKINPGLLVAEIVTFPVILNKLGILLADVETKIAESKLDLEVFEAKQRETIRKNFEATGDKYTIQMVEDAIKKDPTYLARCKKLNNDKKQRDYINSIYWAAKDKSGKIDKLSLSIQPGDYDFSELPKMFNGIKISVTNPLIK